jgi:hypothetical protein
MSMLPGVPPTYVEQQAVDANGNPVTIAVRAPTPGTEAPPSDIPDYLAPRKPGALMPGFGPDTVKMLGFQPKGGPSLSSLALDDVKAGKLPRLPSRCARVLGRSAGPRGHGAGRRPRGLLPHGPPLGHGGHGRTHAAPGRGHVRPHRPAAAQRLRAASRHRGQRAAHASARWGWLRAAARGVASTCAASAARGTRRR